MNKGPRLLFIRPNNSKYKQINISFPKIFMAIIFILFLVGATLKISVDFFINFNQNSKITQLQKKNSILEQQLTQMGETISFIRGQVDKIEDIDDELRLRLDISPIDADVRQVGIGGSDVTPSPGMDLQDAKLQSLLSGNNSVLDRLEREIKLESASFKKLISTLDDKEDSLRYLPALKPVPSARLTGKFGRRLHPIYKRMHFHEGIDLGADRGTPILATADGYVTFTGRNGGYGLFVSINHKYGFETKYGHLQKIYVRKGQFVKRGDKIGEVGNTGLSTAPHLHYEVHYHGKAMNPQDYYFSNIKFE